MMPQMKDNEMFQLLRDEQVETFNNRRDQDEVPDLTQGNLRGCDLKGANLKGLNLEGIYFRNADLRGIDLRDCNLEGATFRDANIGGVFFPDNIDPQEIMLSVKLGTRIRTRK